MLAVLLGALIFVGGLGWGVVVLLMSFFRENK
jgi:hypothetical protein